jgi:hypothetical protein
MEYIFISKFTPRQQQTERFKLNRVTNIFLVDCAYSARMKVNISYVELKHHTGSRAELQAGKLLLYFYPKESGMLCILWMLHQEVFSECFFVQL